MDQQNMSQQSGLESSPNIKCGEIFFATCSNFIVACCLCKCNLSLEHFEEHFHREHIIIVNESVQKQQQCDDISFIVENYNNDENEEEAAYDLVGIKEVIAEDGQCIDDTLFDIVEEKLMHVEIDQVENSKFTDENLIEFNKFDEFEENDNDSLLNLKDNSGPKEHKRNKHNPDSMKEKGRTHKTSNKCDQCHKIFRCYRDLAAHMFKHTGINCDVCGKSFKQVAYLNKHKIRHSTKNYTCKQCKKSFFTAKELKQHMISHTNIFAVICEVCGKGFRNTTQLKAHLRRHTGERPAKCDVHTYVCGKSFYSLHDLNVHDISHSSERPFECDICKLKFQSKKTTPTQAKTSNSANTRNICDKCYTQASGLKLHSRTQNV